MKIDNVDQSSSEKTDEFDKPEEEPGLIQNSNKDITHYQENDDSIDEDVDTD